jgi:hypothetical protein
VIVPRLVIICSGIRWYGFGYGLSPWSVSVVLWQGCKTIMFLVSGKVVKQSFGSSSLLNPVPQLIN